MSESGSSHDSLSPVDLKLLQKAFATGDQAVIVDALGVVARAKGMTAVAQATGVTRKALYIALGEGGNPRFSTLLAVADALGFRLQVAEKK
ncbi:addiction module antidote protein [uncultured Stenotrophomonas sp.]|uniref:addiction module antidote protein n=1 Tax=uncultured Stenotrophomonas sp. TaxID=165438 RepID=UPI0025D43782|nr:addiction module antidote protein [uncultured Stenotrophomonas sp.]